MCQWTEYYTNLQKYKNKRSEAVQSKSSDMSWIALFKTDQILCKVCSFAFYVYLLWMVDPAEILNFAPLQTFVRGNEIIRNYCKI